ncbi:MAG TPA: hypothetical protein VEV15_13560 [Flavisolibacter sp.]|nr:hypothetical protein [Flavisolibacter sp.]
MSVHSILMAPSFNDLNKYEWLVLMTSVTDHCRVDAARFEQLREMVQRWEDNKPDKMPEYTIPASHEQGFGVTV